MTPTTGSGRPRPTTRPWAALRRAGLLRASVRGDAWQRPSPTLARLAGRPLPPGLAAAARFHGVAGYVLRALHAVGADDEVQLAELEALRDATVHAHLRAVRDLDLLRRAFGDDVAWVVVKGPVLSRLHGPADLRTYGDLDVLVPAAVFPRALEVLEAAGGRVLARNWWHRLEVLAGEVPLALPSGTMLDLHWHLLADRRLRDAFTLDMPCLLDRARPVPVAGSQVPTLDAADTLLHLAAHTLLSGGNRLVWLKDLERALGADPPEPGEVLARARSAGLELVVAVALDKVRSVLGPVAGLAGARPATRSGWRAAAALGRRLPPVPWALGGGSPDRMVSRATRTDGVASVLELLRRGRRWADRVADTPLAPRDRAGDAEDEGRRAYLAAVTAEGLRG